MLTVGIDSYITIGDADEYIRGHLRAGDPDRERWENIAEEDKENCIRVACEELERLPWAGTALQKGQRLSFPRKPETSVPIAITAAQAELALWLSDEEARNEDEQRNQLQASGVKSISLGLLSMSFDGDIPTALCCREARKFVTPYLNGGYE